LVIGIFGESCTGKSSLADALAKKLQATVYTGRDYLKFAKNEADAKKNFAEALRRAPSAIYVITELAHLALLPPDALRVYTTAGLDVIQARFAQRMNGSLPAPVAHMLAKKHGMFDNEPRDLRLDGSDTVEGAVNRVMEKLSNTQRSRL